MATVIPLTSLSARTFASPTTIVLTVNPAQPAGGGNFITVQSAIDSIPTSNIQPYRIDIAAGTYDERVLVPTGKEYITLNGTGANNSQVVMTAFDWNGGSNGWEGSQPLRAYANNFRCQNLTLQNTWGDNGQAMALKTGGDKQVFENVQILGWQDTLYVGTGRQYFHNSTIKGRVDFLWGPGTAVFDQDNLVSRIRQNSGGYVTAANTPASQTYGYVIRDSHLIAENTDGSTVTSSTNLGRPWAAGAASSYAQVAYINTVMDTHIKPAGWDDWGNPLNQQTARYSEYGSSGAGGNTSQRANWATVMTTPEQAAFYATSNVFAGWDPLNTPMVPVNWVGGNGNWSAAANWDSGAAPMIGQNLYIQPAASSTVTIDGAAVGDQLAVGKSGTPSTLNVTATGNLNISGGLFLSGGSTINIDGGTVAAPSVTVDVTGTTNAIYLKNNGHLNIGNWTGPWGPSGMLVINNGTFSTKGFDGAQIRMAPSSGDVATVNIAAGDNWSKTRFIETGDGTSVINQSGGTVNGTYGPYLGNTGAGGGSATYNFSGGTAYWLDPTLGKSRGGTFTVNQSGGTLNKLGNTESFNDGVIAVANAGGSNATWNLSAGSINHRGLAIGNSGAGKFVQTGGSVTLNQPIVGSTKGSGLKIGYGSGTGVYQISGGSLTVQNGGLTLGYKIDGTAASGTGELDDIGGFSLINITGDYKQNAGSTLAAWLNASGLSTINVAGNVVFTPGAVLDLHNGGAANGTYTLMTWTGTLSGTPTLAATVDLSKWSYALDPTARTLSVTYVPEPSVMAIPIVAMAVSRRRDRCRRTVRMGQ